MLPMRTRGDMQNSGCACKPTSAGRDAWVDLLPQEVNLCSVCRARTAGLGSGFLHDEKIVESAEKEIAFFGRFAVVAHFESFVVAGDGDDVGGAEIFAETGE